MKVRGSVFAFAFVVSAIATGASHAQNVSYASPQPCEALKAYEQPLARARGDGRPDVSNLKVLLDRNYNIIAFGNDFTRGGHLLHEVYCLDRLVAGVTTTRTQSTLYTGPVTRIRAPAFAPTATRVNIVFDYFFDFFAMGQDRWRHKTIAVERRGDAWVLVNERNQPVREIYLRATSTGIKHIDLNP